jgi:hypothetical protein
MSTTELDILRAPAGRRPAPNGPVTARRLRRTALVYGTLCLIGLVPILLQMAPSWQAAGLGLWLPGAGFVAVGGWAVALFPVTLVLFALSVIAWFWAGAVIAPILVWGGAAVTAGAMADAAGGPAAHIIVAFIVGTAAVLLRSRGAAVRKKGEKVFAERLAFLPQSLAEVAEQTARAPDPTTREMTPDQLASLRYVLDRALQPIEAFNGFDIIDQFQPAALRYQLNHMGYALGVAQGAYTPSFQGYMGAAQRNLIEKYLLRRVWDYWVYESCWGHFNFTDFDPAANDNIMLTGWFGAHVGQYMLNSGDRRYAEVGSLTFRLNRKTAYPHDLHTINRSITHNQDGADFYLYPCEPNWIYPVCNHYGMTSLAVHDAVFGTTFAADRLPKWIEMLDTEFTNAQGSIIGLRSQHTGLEVPFPVGETTYSVFENCFAPERARRQWAIARKDLEQCLVEDDQGRPRLKLPGKGLDPGNYKTGFVYTYASVLIGAREFGEDRIAEAAERGLEVDCGGVNVDGVTRYAGGSNLANADVVLGKLMRTGDFRRSFVEGPPKCALEGPVLAEAIYPDVLVARAFSDGENLDLVLYPGRPDEGAGTQTIRLERLKSGRDYSVAGASPGRFTADPDGTAHLDVALVGRTPVTVTLVGD